SSWTGGNNRNQRYSGYAQDRWNLNGRTTITAGIRWDYQRPYYLTGERDPLIKDVLPASVVNPSIASSTALVGQPMFKAQSFAQGDIVTRNSFAPRVGVSYDVTGIGNTVLIACFIRYYIKLA